MSRNSFLPLFTLCILVLGCKSDNTVKKSYELEGKWDIYEAYRDGNLTTTLEDGFFEFQDSQMVTNILGSPIDGVYILDNKSIQHESSLSATYHISNYSSDSMELETEIRGFDFLFKLQRIADTIPSQIQ